MKTLEVVAAIIRRDGCILATQRDSGEFAGGWEFPGGKVEPGETPERALEREIREELGAEVGIERLVAEIDYDYDSFHLHMLCYLCHVESGRLELREHRAARWLDADGLGALDWLPADEGVIRAIREQRLLGDDAGEGGGSSATSDVQEKPLAPSVARPEGNSEGGAR